MSRLFKTLFVFLAVASSPKLARASSSTCNFQKTGTTQACTISFSDANGPETRNVRLHIPNGAQSGAPVVIYLHGAPGGEYECDGTGWPAKCDAAGCVLVCPRGGKVVNGGYSWNSLSPSTTPDDVEYIREIVDLLAQNLHSDAQRVFVTGFSAGGWMSHRVAYEAGDIVAAIGTIASSLYIRDAGLSTALPNAMAPVSVIHLQGTADASIFYCGETSPSVTVASQDDTFAYWSGSQGNGCTSVSQSQPLCTASHGTSVPGGTIGSVTHEKASGCAAGTEVEFYRLNGGTHKYYGTEDFSTAPGNATQPYSPDVTSTTGTTGVDLLWNFFSSHPKSGAISDPDAGAAGAGGSSDNDSGAAGATANGGSSSGSGGQVGFDAGASGSGGMAPAIDGGHTGDASPSTTSAPSSADDSSGCQLDGRSRPRAPIPFVSALLGLLVARRRRRAGIAKLSVLALVPALAACGSDSNSTATATGGSSALGGGAGASTGGSAGVNGNASGASGGASGGPSIDAGVAGAAGSGASSASAIAPDFFGLTSGPPDDPGAYPSVAFGIVGHPGLLAWGATQAAPGASGYDFSYYDAQIDKAAAHGLPAYISFGWTPPWAVSDKSTCVSNPPHCTAPPDSIDDWKNFVATIAARYAGKVRYWEIWNEANGPSFWSGSVDELVELASVAYPILKQADPNALVVAPSTSGSIAKATAWLASYLDAGGAAYADACAAHGYPAQMSPLPFPEEESSNGSILTRLAAFRKTCDDHGLAGKPLVMSEGSWGKNQYLTDPSAQAAWLSRYLLLQASARDELDLVTTNWYAWGAGGPGQYGSIANSDESPTLAGAAFGQVDQWLVGANLSPCKLSSDGVTESCPLTRPDDASYHGLVIWSTKGTPSIPVPPGFSTARALDGTKLALDGKDLVVSSMPELLE